MPKQWIPSVEQGVRDAMEKGPLGFPVTDVEVVLVDGSYHAVDSSEMSFRAAGRLAMLKATAKTKIDMFEFMKTFTGPPTALDIEWLVSGEDMAKIMRRIRDLDDPTAREIMAVNTAVPDYLRGDWRYVGYKGGSEPGVINLSWLLQDQVGKWHVVTLTWNNPDAPVDLEAFRALALRAIALARPK